MTGREAGLRLYRCCFTGHRPEKLGIAEAQAKDILRDAVRQAAGAGFRTFITGMARGADIWAGETVLELKAYSPGIKLVAACPFEGFEDRWSRDWKQRYRSLLQSADAVRFICEHYRKDAFDRRNKWMVDRSSLVIALYNGAPGGTRNTIMYAARKGTRVVSPLHPVPAMPRDFQKGTAEH